MDRYYHTLLRLILSGCSAILCFWSAIVIAVAPPGFFVTPLIVDFGPIGVGVTSPPQTITITNTSAQTLTNFAGGAPFDTQFGAAQNCASGVAPGASCQYFFTFTPSAVGEFTTFSNSSTNGGPFSIELRGSGVGPGLSVSPLSVDFGRVVVANTSATQTITIRNTGLAMLTNFAGGAPFDTQFGASQNCAGGVAPGASCQYFFIFTPATTGVFTTASNSSTNAGPFSIDLTGTGRDPIDPVPLAPLLWVTPLTLDFGPVGVGFTSAAQTVTITNQGVLTLTSFAGGAPFDNQFSAVQNCADGVAPGNSCQYTFRFSPTAEGEFTTTSNSSTNAGPFVIELRGTGVGAELSVTQLSLDFGPVALGVTSPPQVVTIRNTGLATLANFAGGAPFDNQFSAVQNCAGGVAPGASCQYTFRFTPTLAGFNFSRSNSSTNAGSFSIELQGFGSGGLNQPPTAFDDNYIVLNNATLNIAAPGVLANDIDAEADSLTTLLQATVTNGTLNLNPDGGFSYTPDAGFNGVDSFTYQASDATGNSNLATVTLTVTQQQIYDDQFE